MVPLLYLRDYDPSTFGPLVGIHYQFQVDLLVDLLNSLTFLGLLEKPVCCQNTSRLKLTLAKQETK